MKFLNRFIGDNLQLKGPKFDSAVTHTVDLSGTKLSFPAPKQTALMPGHVQRFEFDLSNASEYKKWGGSENSGFKIHANGWSLTGKKKRDFGYVLVDISLAKLESLGDRATLFNKEDAIKWLLSYLEDTYGRSNKETIQGLEEQAKGQSYEGKLWVYPRTGSEFSFLNNINAINYSLQVPGSGINIQYWTPISSDHFIKIAFTLRTVDVEFFSPEHNFPEAAEKLVKDYMNRVKVELSPEAELERKAATGN